MPEQVARLADALRRLVAAPGLSQPELVRALDAGLEGSTAYLAMEYVAAETLDVALRHLAPAPLERALPILSRIADAIDAAWAVGIGHGALHPRDVFVTVDTQEVRMTGFGVLPAVESIGGKAPVRRPYSAPERANGDPWDIRADVYSLGAIAHELLTRRRPAGSGEQDGALTTDTTPEQRVQIRRVLSAVLAERPQHRFSSARAFTDALAAIARGESLPAMPEAAPSEEAEIVGLEAVPEEAPATGLAAVAVASGNEAAAPTPDLGPRTPDPGLRTASAQPDVVTAPRPEPALVERPMAPDFGEPPPPDGRFARGSGEPSPSPVSIDAIEASERIPWSVVLAVGAAALLVGVGIGFQWGKSAIQAPVPATETAVPRSSETEVTPPPEPVEPPARQPAGGAVAEAARDEPLAASRRAAPRGRLTVRSVPPGAMLTIDGRPRGQTPASVADLALGDHTVEVARSGFVPHRERVTLSGGTPARTLSVRLQAGLSTPGSEPGAIAATGSLFVDSRPQGARVIIDNRYAGMTPLRVPAVREGRHEVRLERAGYRSFSTVVGVKPGEPARVTAALEEQRN